MRLNKYNNVFCACFLLLGVFSLSHAAPLENVDYQAQYLRLFSPDQTSPKDFESYDHARRLAMVWVAHSPKEAIDWLAKNPTQGDLASMLLLEVITRLSFNTGESILKTRQQLPQAYRATYLEWVLNVRAQANLSEGDEELIPLYFSEDNLVYSFAKMCVEPDFLGLIGHLTAAKCSPETKKFAYGILLERWLDDAPDEVQAHIENKTLEELSQQEEFIQKWADGAPEKVVSLLSHLAIAENLEPSAPEIKILANAIGAWIDTDEYAALAWVDSVNDSKLAGCLARAVVEASIQRDGTLAVSYFSRLQDEASRVALAPELAKLLADRDPVAGVEWIRNTASIMDLRPAVSEFYYHLAKYDLAYAVDIYPSDMPVGLQQETIREIMKSAHQVDIDEVYSWMESLEPRATHDYVLPFWFQGYVGLNPERAAEYIRQHPLSGKHHRPNHHVGTVWAAQDPDAAIAWAMSLTHHHAKSGAGYGITEGLLELSDEQTLNWLKSLPKGPMLDWSVAALYDNRWEQRPEVVFDMALKMTDQMIKRRRKFLEDTLEAMHKQGNMNATMILQRTDIPEKDREWLQDFLQNN